MNSTNEKCTICTCYACIDPREPFSFAPCPAAASTHNHSLSCFNFSFTWKIIISLHSKVSPACNWVPREMHSGCSTVRYWSWFWNLLKSTQSSQSCKHGTGAILFAPYMRITRVGKPPPPVRTCILMDRQVAVQKSFVSSGVPMVSCFLRCPSGCNWEPVTRGDNRKCTPVQLCFRPCGGQWSFPRMRWLWWKSWIARRHGMYTHMTCIHTCVRCTAAALWRVERLLRAKRSRLDGCGGWCHLTGRCGQSLFHFSPFFLFSLLSFCCPFVHSVISLYFYLNALTAIFTRPHSWYFHPVECKRKYKLEALDWYQTWSGLVLCILHSSWALERPLLLQGLGGPRCWNQSKLPTTTIHQHHQQ